MVNDIVGDSLARIKNAISRGKRNVVLMHSTLLKNVLEIMKQEKYIVDFEIVSESDFKKTINVTLLADDKKDLKAINELKRISKPGLRIYRGYKEIKPVLNGYGLAIISTPKGVLSDTSCRKQRVGGEVLCYIY